MNRLEKLKYDLSQKHFNTFGQGAFIKGFEAASAEYEKIIAELEVALKNSYMSMTFCLSNEKQPKQYMLIEILNSLKKLKEFRGIK